MSATEVVLAAVRAGARPRDLESPVLEFKAEAGSPKTSLELLADAVVCLANASGGTILFGVADDVAGPEAFVGVRDLDARRVISGIFDRTVPALSVPVNSYIEDGKQIFEVIVPMGATIYANAKGTATRRVNDECRPFPPEEQRQALASRGIHDWSARRSPVIETDDVEMGRVRRLLREAGHEALAAQDDHALLTDLRLCAADGRLTNAGLLLVGREADLAEHIPSHGFSYQYRPSPGSEATGRLRAQRPILAAIEQLIDAIASRVQVSPLNVSGGVQLRREDYPADAVRELVVNALVHRDFTITGTVDVEHSPEVLRVSSPGGLVFGVTPENILSHPSTPRNRLLLETVTLLQVAERTGQGIDRTYRSLLRSGKKPPTFADTGSRVDVHVEGGSGNGAFTRYVRGQLEESLASDLDVLLVLDALCSSRRVSADQVAPAIQRTREEAQRVLARMAGVDIVAPTRRTAAHSYPQYELTPASLVGLGLAVLYNRRKAEGSEDKVIEHLREYGFITNQTIRRLLDVEVYAARDVLSDLVRRGVIVKSAGAARGPSVRYEPGPQFPRK